MRKYMFRQKVKALLSFLCILILLPYIVTVFLNGSDLSDPGKIRAAYVRYTDGSQVRQVLWEEYFVGVMAKEISAECELETLKAQAVVLRTSLYQELENSEEKEFKTGYFSIQELKKKWGSDFREYYNKILKAIQETESNVLYFNGEYAFLPFHQSSCGKTRSAAEIWGKEEYPYLTSKECPKDKEAEEEIHVYRISCQEIQKTFQADFVALQEASEEPLSFADFEIISTDSAGYVTEIKIRGTTLSGEKFRQELGLASSAFSLKEEEPNGLVITTSGNGHGFGMSQWTADEMAKSGKNYEEILSYFFEGTNLEDAGEIFTKLE